MNSLVKSAKFASVWLKNVSPTMTAVRHHWNKDYEPGPFPKTQQERIAAAKKYGLLPEEYDAYPDDGTGAGDYPKLPIESTDSRDPFYPWDNPELKRNFQETLHEDYDYMRDDRYDANRKYHLPVWALLLQFLGVMAVLYAAIEFSKKQPMFLAVVPPQIPKEGKVHYTFEEP